jgi:hypothetical protein
MAFTDNLRQQHAEITIMIEGIAALLDRPAGPAQKAELRQALSRLAEKLVRHLALEDEILYPLLAQHTDAGARVLGAAFTVEMSGVRPAFESFNARWTETAIAADPAAFVGAAQQIFGTIRDRILRENRQLYPAADKAALSLQLCAPSAPSRRRGHA